MRKKSRLVVFGLLGLLLFGCGKKTVTTKTKTTTKTTTPVVTKPTTKTTKTTKTTMTTKTEAKKYTVTVNSDKPNAGTINGVGQATEGTDVVLTAVANQGYTFLGFYNGDTKVSEGNSNTYTIAKIDKNVTLTAKWAVQSFTLTVESVNEDEYGVANGEVTYEGQDVDGKVWETDTVITLTATPYEGYQFNGWYLVGATDALSTDPIYDFHMLGQNTTIQALFGIKKCNVEVVANIPEAMEAYYIYDYDLDYEYENSSATFNYDQEFAVYVDVCDGYGLVGFYLLDENGEYDPDDLIDDSCVTWYAYDDYKFIAVFEAYNYDLFVIENVKNGGTYTGVYKEVDYDEDMIDGGFTVEFATSITLTATAAEGYTFVGWYADDEFETQLSTDATYTYKVTVADDNYIYIKYVANDVQINFSVDSVDGEGNPLGTINVESGKYAFNSNIRITATANTGYKFDGWYIKTWNAETEVYDYVLYSDGWDDEFFVESLDEVSIAAKFSAQVIDGCGHINIDNLDDAIYSYLYENYTDKPFTYGQEVTFVAPTDLTGYKFEGWYYGEYSGKEFAEISSDYLLSENATYTFIWEYTFDDPKYISEGCICFTAVYSRYMYKVTYAPTAQVTTTKAFINVPYGLVTKLEVPTTTVNGQVFNGWQYIDGEGNYVMFTDTQGNMLEPYAFADGITIYSTWIARDLTVIFDTDGGTDIPNATVEYGNLVTRPADPEKDGYTFDKWYNADGQEWVWNTFTIVADTTIYAKYTINQYEITIESQNDSIVTDNSDSVNGTYNFATEIRLFATIIEGYTFTGWFDGTDLVSDELEYMYSLPSKNVTLVAKYEINQYEVTVTLKGYWSFIDFSDIEVTGAGTYDFGSTISLKTIFSHDAQFIAYYRTNYSGSWGYITNTAGNYITTNPYEFTLPARDVSFEICINHHYKTLSVVKNISEGTNPYFTFLSQTGTHYTSVGIYYDSFVYLHAYEIPGYTFTGWYYYGTDTLYSAELNNVRYTMPYESVKFEARYTPNEYVLTVNKNIEDNIESTPNIILDDNYDVAYHSTFELSCDEMIGYEFLGWFISGSSTPLTTDWVYEYEMPRQNMTVEARYVIIEYEIFFQAGISNTNWNLEPGTIDLEGFYYNDHNQVIENTATVNNGWTFLGWYLDTDDNEGFSRTSLSSYTLLTTNLELSYTINGADVSIYAVYAAKTYYINLNENGGHITGSDSIEVLMGDNFTLEVPTPPTDSVFIKWVYSSKGTTYDLTNKLGVSTNPYNFPVESEEITAKAVYGEAIRTITFETGYQSTWYSTDTRTFTSDIVSGTAVARPDDPVRRGYTFLGWFTEATDGEEWTFTSTISADKTLYAHWSVNSYTLTIKNFYGVRGIVYYSSDDYDGTLVSSGTANVAATATITVKYGETITLEIETYLGRNRTSIYKRAVSGSWYYITANNTNESFIIDYVMDYDSNAEIQIEMYSNDEMKYFEFDSTATTCTINSLTTAGKSATSLVVPDYVTKISTSAFSGNSVLTTLTLPFTGNGRDTAETSGGKEFAVIFNSTSATGYREVQPYYYNSSNTKTEAIKRYLPQDLAYVTITDETKIARCAFENCGLSEIILNDGITEIGAYALHNNMIDTDLSLPSTLTTIGDYAFMDMTDRENYTMPSLELPCDKVTYIGRGAFADNDIETLIIPFIGKTYDATGAEALVTWFYLDADSESQYNYNVTQHYNGSSTQSAYVTSYLKHIIVESNKANYYLKFGACEGLSELQTFEFEYNGSSTFDILEYTFKGCSNLTDVSGTYFTNASNINTYAFQDCAKLTEVAFNKVSNINSSAFKNCTSLTSFETNYTASVYVYSSAFENCTAMTVFSAPRAATIWIYNRGFAECKELTSIGNGNGSIHFGNYAMYNCESLTTISISKYTSSNSTTKLIGDYAFAGCTKLAAFDFTADTSAAYKNYGSHIFEGCTELTTVVLYEGATEIGAQIFAGCTKLRYITVPYVGKAATGGSLTTFNVDYTVFYFFGNTKVGDMVEAQWNGVKYYYPNTIMEYTLTNIGSLWYYSFRGMANRLYKLTIVKSQNADGLYSIGNSAVWNCFLSGGLSLAEGLTSIGDSAFTCCWNLRLTTLPSTLTTIGDGAFYKAYTSYTTDLVLPDSVTTIGPSAFGYNSKLTSVKLGSGITTIGVNAFAGCDEAFTLSFNGTSSAFGSKMQNFATGWNTITDTLSIHACVCKDTTYSW